MFRADIAGLHCLYVSTVDFARRQLSMPTFKYNPSSTKVCAAYSDLKVNVKQKPTTSP